jgi:hydrogenase expression/formation protein HypC
MCLGIPGEIVEYLPEQPDLAKVNVSGVKRVINVGLLADDMPEPGEWVLIHVGFALSKIDETEAAAALSFLEGIGRPMQTSSPPWPTHGSSREHRHEIRR